MFYIIGIALSITLGANEDVKNEHNAVIRPVCKQRAIIKDEVQGLRWVRNRSILKRM